MKIAFTTLGLFLFCNLTWAQEEAKQSENVHEKPIRPLASVCSMTPQYNSEVLYKESWVDNGGFPQREMENQCRLKGGHYIASVIMTDNPSPFTWYGGIRRDMRRTFSYECYKSVAIPVKTCERLHNCLLTNTFPEAQSYILYYYDFFKCDKETPSKNTKTMPHIQSTESNFGG